MSHRWPNGEQKGIIFRRLGYEPHAEQAAIHGARAEVVQIVGAEGGGKSYVTAAEVTALAPWCRLIYLVGETYTNTRPEFEYLTGNLIDLGLLRPERVRVDDMGKGVLVTETGCKIVTVSARKGASAIIARGEQPDVIVLCEAGIIRSFGVATAAVRRVTRVKGRCILVGTLKDNFGWYAALVDELTPKGNAWRGETYSLPAWSNLHLYPGGREDPEIRRLERILPADEFSRTVAAQKVRSKALVFPEFAYSVHMRPCPFDPTRPVYVWIDPGYYPSAYVVLAVQFHESGLGETEVWIIDELYLNFHTHKQVIQLASTREWWPKVGEGVIDVAGKQHHAEESAVEVWSHEAGLRLHTNKVGIMDGIARHRDFLGGPQGAPQGDALCAARLFHDAEKCVMTGREYGLYRRPADQDGNATGDVPVDKDNHAMKAIAYGLVHYFGFADRSREAVSKVIRREARDGGGWR